MAISTGRTLDRVLFVLSEGCGVVLWVVVVEGEEGIMGS